MGTPAAGSIIAQRYELRSVLGSGGMGTVWAAEHTSLKSPVAVKFLDPVVAQDPTILERFLREAQAAAALRSVNVVQIFDYGVFEGTPYIAMELLQGESLRERVDRLGRLSPEDTAKVILHVSRAMARAHDMGVVHRDLKPENVFIAQDDEEVVKVLDFGIAKVTHGDLVGRSDSRTKTGSLLGTPYYMSPEQAQGNRVVDARSDLWSLAVICFECLTGRPPFDSEALGDLILAICTREPPRPSSLAAVPQGFDAWFARGVAKDPEARFQTARELAESFSLIAGIGDTGGVAGGAMPFSAQAVRLEAAALTAGPVDPSRAPQRLPEGAGGSLGAGRSRAALGTTGGTSSVELPVRKLARGWAWGALALFGLIVLLGALGYWLRAGDAPMASDADAAPNAAAAAPPTQAPPAQAPSVDAPRAPRPPSSDATATATPAAPLGPVRPSAAPEATAAAMPGARVPSPVPAASPQPQPERPRAARPTPRPVRPRSPRAPATPSRPATPASPAPAGDDLFQERQW